MAEQFSRTTPLSHVEQRGINVDDATVRLSIIESRAIAQVMCSPGNAAAVANALAIGVTPGQATTTDDYNALPLSPGQWMLYTPSQQQGSDAAAAMNGGFAQFLNERLNGQGYVSEQSHGRVIFRVAGEGARAVIEKGCRLDLHPSVTQAGYCAQTPMAQVGVILHQVSEDPVYDLLVYSGFARSFWHWLTESAAEFGFRVTNNQD